MGFTIDMVSGNISNITNGIHSENAEMAVPRKPSIPPSVTSIGRVDVNNVDISKSKESLQEQLLPVVDTLIKPDYSIPTSLINRDVDSFIEDVAR